MSQQLNQLPPRLEACLPLKPDQHLLDFGAGTGLLSLPLAQRVAQVTALDTSAKMLAVLASKGIANIQVRQQDLFTGLNQRFDGIVSCMALHHVEQIPALLNAFAQHLHPGGFVALVDLYQEDGSFHGDNQAKGVWHFGFDPDILTAWLIQAGFSAIHSRNIHQLEHRNGRSYPLFLLQACRNV